MTEPTQDAKKSEPRMLFNRGGMAFILKPLTPGGDKRVFKTGTAIMPEDIMYGKMTEEKFLLSYEDAVVYADTIMPATNNAAELATAKKKVADLTAENAELKKLGESMAVGATGPKTNKK